MPDINCYSFISLYVTIREMYANFASQNVIRTGRGGDLPTKISWRVTKCRALACRADSTIRDTFPQHRNYVCCCARWPPFKTVFTTEN